MLKNVVLPAPFGPMRLTMARSGMSKSTELTATSPPKTLVIPRASRILAPPLAAAAFVAAPFAAFAFGTFVSRSRRSCGVSLLFSGMGPLSQGVAPVAAVATTTVQLLGALAVGDNSLRPQEHHDDKDDAE